MPAPNWDLIFRILGPIAGAITGWLLGRWSERRSKLVTYYGHVSAFQARPEPAADGQPAPPPFAVHSHSVVIRNAGRRAATNVRVTHQYLPRDYNVSPAVPYTVEQLEGGVDIVFPQLIPEQQVTISYLYPGHVVWSQITKDVMSDDGYATVLTLLPMPQPPRWATVAAWILMGVGATTVLYLAITLGVGALAHR
jgi:hypothetical protein